jgi:hypothetical protein
MTVRFRRVRFYRKMLQHAISRQIANLLPAPVVYWAVLRAISYATSGKYGTTTPDLSSMEMLHRYSRDHKVNT